ncbi:hypothetical protein FACS1894216_03350 [Synergistales bacterium]|nr:hypothetical protein FACS1894216_03350 [Synergistales bacterium]
MGTHWGEIFGGFVTEMRIFRFGAAALLLMLALLAASASVAEAAVPNGVEAVIEQSMRRALASEGLDAKSASGIAKRYTFIGTVIILKNIDALNEEGLLARAEQTGDVLGRALGVVYKVYGSRNLDETASAIMHTARAGISPYAAERAISALALNGYPFESSLSAVNETVEFARFDISPQATAGLFNIVSKMAAAKEPVQNMRSAMLASVKAERAKQEALLAQRVYKERMANSKGGGNGGSSNKNGRSSASAASNNGGSSSGSASSAGGASGSGSGSGTAGGAAGNSGGSSGNSGGSSGGDGGNSGSGGGNSGSGGNGGNSDGGNSGGNGGNSGSNGGNSGSSGNSGNSGSGGDGGNAGGNSGGGGGNSGGNNGGDSGAGK